MPETLIGDIPPHAEDRVAVSELKSSVLDTGADLAAKDVAFRLLAEPERSVSTLFWC